MKNFIRTPLSITDAYKLSHWCQYPKGTTGIYSNYTPRKSRIPNVDKFVFFGFQYFFQQLNDQFDNNFFNLDEDAAVNNYDSFHTEFFGVPNTFNNDQVRKLHKLGHLPIRVKALPEGSVVNHNRPVATLRSTDDELFWFTQWIETWLSDSTWKLGTAATTGWYYRKILKKYHELTSDVDFMDFQCHGFEMRGMGGLEDAMCVAAGHLLSFKGEDTLPVIDWVHNYYPGDNGLVATSVPATEHAVACSYRFEGTDEESDTAYIQNILNIYPTGIVSIVADTYDFWGLVTKVLPKFKDQILARDGKVVIRPDSSPKTPYEIVVGDAEESEGTPENKGLVRCLYEIFGGSVNSKGFIDLDPHIGCIYGEGINHDLYDKILNGLMANGFSSNNLVVGVGSFSYTFVTRDSHGIAIKATAAAEGYGENQVWRAMYKDPKTDNSGKKSARGFLRVDLVDGEYVLTQDVSEEEEKGGALEIVYENGKIIRTQSFNEVRAELEKF